MFSIAFPSEPRPSEAKLFLRAGSQPTFSYGAFLDVDTVTIVRDLRKLPLPPFAEVTYWWEYRLPSGERIRTASEVFAYVDNRFDWETASDDGVEIHWVTGDRATMMQALTVAQDARAQMQWALQTPNPADVAIYIYPSRTDLASAMQLTGLDWAGAIAYPEPGIVLISIPPTQEAFVAIGRDIPHELAHKALYDTLGEQGYASLPTWLVEGLATYFETSPDTDHALALANAHEQGDLIPLANLCAPFPEEADRALLAYAQSGSVVRYLREQVGWSGIRDLLNAYADGMACNTGTQEALGMDLAQLEWDWRVWLEQDAQPTSTSPLWATAVVLLRDVGPWLLLTGALLLPALLIVLRTRL